MFSLPAIATDFNVDLQYNEIADIQGTDSVSTQEYNVFTEFDGIKCSAEGNYAMEINSGDDTTYIPVGRLDVDLLDAEEYAAVVSRKDITEEVKERMAELREIAITSGKSSFVISFFSSELLPQARTTTYYMYNGYRMRCDRIVSSDLNTGYVNLASGVSTKEVTKALSSLIISAIGLVPGMEAVAVLSTGISLLDYAKAENSIYITGHRNDFAQGRVIYDVTDQWTYAEINGKWMLGLISQSVHIDRIDTSQYYYNATLREGKTIDSVYYPNETIPTPSYDSLATAFQYAYQTQTEKLKLDFGSYILYF